MGLGNSKQNIKYLRLKEGKFYVGKDTETPYGELEGLITGMRYKDEEYEGDKKRKLILTIYAEDEDQTYQLGLNVETRNYSSLVSFLRNADLTKPLTLHPKYETSNKDGKDVKTFSILVSQNGQYCKGYFTKDNANGLPKWKTVKVGNKKITDKSDYLEYLEEFVTRNYIPVVNKGIKGTVLTSQGVGKSPVEEPVVVDSATDETEDVDKLPWDE